MRPLLKLSQSIVCLLALCIPITSQAQKYQVDNNFSINQTNLIITPLLDGNNLWDIQVSVTNNNPYAVTDAIMAVNEAWLNNNQTIPAQWNNSNQTWNYLGNEAFASNSDFLLSMDPANTNLPVEPAFNVTAADSISGWDFGGFAAGQTIPEDIDYEITPGVSLSFFNPAIVVPGVPEPGGFAVAILWLGLTSAAVIRRRSQKRQAHASHY